MQYISQNYNGIQKLFVLLLDIVAHNEAIEKYGKQASLLK